VCEHQIKLSKKDFNFLISMRKGWLPLYFHLSVKSVVYTNITHSASKILFIILILELKIASLKWQFLGFVISINTNLIINKSCLQLKRYEIIEVETVTQYLHIQFYMTLFLKLGIAQNNFFHVGWMKVICSVLLSGHLNLRCLGKKYVNRG
jgi:hypothetical protein